MAIEQTVAMVKPDGVKRNLVHEVILSYKGSGLKIIDMRVFVFTPSLAMDFYREHIDRSFFGSLIDHMTSGPVVALLLSGQNAISLVRELNGATNPEEATRESLRGQFLIRGFFDRIKPAANFVHGSDSPDAATRELKLLFLS